MIYAVAMFGFLEARLAIESFIANGRTDTSSGQYVFQTLDEAISAAEQNNQKNLSNYPADKKKLGENASWVVVGVEADWDRDTVLADTHCPFPTANELLFDRPLVEIQQTLPLCLEEKMFPKEPTKPF